MYLPTTQQDTVRRQSSAHLIPLSSTIKLPVSKDERGPIPQTPAYAPIQQITRTGFSFKFIKLLHAIGCKTASLPSSDRTECVRSAYLFTKLLRLTDQGNIYLKELHDPDLQTPRSQELGIGMLCLFAREHWKIPWDALEPIPGQGKRFDYRGQTKSLKAIFEAKGTRHRKNQQKQIADGLSKKQAHRKRGEKHDIELIISTHIGGHRDRSRLLLADPEFPDDGFSFGPKSDDFFKLRHYARVFHFIGAPSLGFQLRQEADLIYRSARGPSFPFADALMGRSFQRRPDTPLVLTEHAAGGSLFLGTWYDSWRPSQEGTPQETDFINIKLQEFQPAIRVFQGVRADLVQDIERQGPLSLLDNSSLDAPETVVEEGPLVSSLFSDGSILSIQYL